MSTVPDSYDVFFRQLQLDAVVEHETCHDVVAAQLLELGSVAAHENQIGLFALVHLEFCVLALKCELGPLAARQFGHGLFGYRSVGVEQTLEFVVFQPGFSTAFVDNILSRLLPVLLHAAYESTWSGRLPSLEVFEKCAPAPLAGPSPDFPV